MNRLKDIFAVLAFAGCAVLVMLFPAETGKGISMGITLCLEKVVPSVFPMMLISVMAVECGFAQKAGRRLAPLSRWLFGLPGEAAAAVLLSVTGGYPAGAKTVAELYECGAVTKKQAARMILFCFCSGPAFLIGMVGGLTGSAAAGWLLMAVQAVTVVVLGSVICRLTGKGETTKRKSLKPSGVLQEKKTMTEAVIASVRKTADAVMQVCLYVAVFSAAGELVERIGLADAAEGFLIWLGLNRRMAEAVVPSLLEVTGGCVSSLKAGLPMIAFAVGFGGFSVHLQVLAIAGGLDVNRLHFFAARIAQGVLSALLTAAALELLPDGAVLPVSAQPFIPALSGSPQGAVVLVIMCAVCVLCLPSEGAAASSINRRDCNA